MYCHRHCLNEECSETLEVMVVELCLVLDAPSFALNVSGIIVHVQLTLWDQVARDNKRLPFVMQLVDHEPIYLSCKLLDQSKSDHLGKVYLTSSLDEGQRSRLSSVSFILASVNFL